MVAALPNYEVRSSIPGMDAYFDEKDKLEMESVKMVRQLVVFEKGYAMMQEGEKPEAVRETILGSGSSAAKTLAIELHMTDKATCLKQLLTLWRGLSDDEQDDQRIHRAVTLSGSKPKDFMESLAIKITNPHWMKGRWWQWKQWERVKVEHAKLLPGLDLDNLEVTGSHLDRLDSSTLLPSVLKHLVPTPGEAREFRRNDGKGLFSFLMGLFINTSHKVEYSVYWCGVQGLFELPGADPTRYMMVLGEMCHAPPDVFQTVIGQAMVRHHWTLTFHWGFCVDRVIDMVSIVLLFSMAQSTHVQQLPLWRDIYGSFSFSLLSLLCNTCAYIQCLIIYKTLRPVATFWNIVFALCDLSTVSVMSYLMYTNYNIFNGQWQRNLTEREHDFKNSFFDLHPVIFAMLVAGKWFYMLLGLLNLEFIGTAILPVWDAARSRESMVFLVYLLLGTIACAHSYYTFAIDDIPDVFMSFFRMIRLTFLGDFDVMEIMGVDQHMALSNVTALYEAASRNNTDYQEAIFGGIDDDDQPMFKYGIRAWMLMWAFIGPVMFMNIYIGLLGAAYEDALGNIEAVFAQFRISTVMMNLLRRHFWLNPATNACKFLRMGCVKEEARNFVARTQQSKDHKFEGYWIVIPATLVKVADDHDDISDKLDDFSKLVGMDVSNMRTESHAMKEKMNQDLATIQGEHKEMKDEVGEMKALLLRALQRKA